MSSRNEPECGFSGLNTPAQLLRGNTSGVYLCVSFITYRKIDFRLFSSLSPCVCVSHAHFTHGSLKAQKNTRFEAKEVGS